jgi:hypothetical protein
MANDKVIYLCGDNGGGLHMTDGEVVVSGLERNAFGSLIEDILTFGEWQEDADSRTPYAEMETLFRHPSTEVIASYDGRNLVINAHATGIAGRRYAGLPAEALTW